MIRVGILISGGGSNMDRLITAMQAEKFALPAIVISNKAGAGGLAKAAAHSVPSTTIPHGDFAERAAFETAIDTALRDAKVDLICLAGFMRVLSAEFLLKWPDQVFNIHPSLLPKYRGLNTHQRALDAGEARHGCTVHIVVPELDAGPILGQSEVPVMADDTADTLAARVLVAEHQLYPQCLQQYCDRLSSKT